MNLRPIAEPYRSLCLLSSCSSPPWSILGTAATRVDQRVKTGRAGEKRRVNGDSAMAFGGAVRGNAPIMTATRTPRSKPKIIQRAFGRMTSPRPQNTPAAARIGWEWRAGIFGTPRNFQISNVIVAQTQSTQAPRLAPLPIISACCIFPTVLPISITRSAAATDGSASDPLL